MTKDESSLRQEMVAIERRAYEKNVQAGLGGNCSARLSENEVLITPSGVCKGFLSAEQFVKIDMSGKVLSAIPGYTRPARDWRMHLELYRLRPDISAIAHAHPPITTGFAIAGLPLDKVSGPEALFAFNGIQVTAYATPTTEQVPEVLRESFAKNPKCEAFILAGHGAVTLGRDPWDAYYKLETLESYLASVLVARLLGREEPLTKNQLAEIEELMRGE